MSATAAVIHFEQQRLLRHMESCKAFDPASAIDPAALPIGLAEALSFCMGSGWIKQTAQGCVYLERNAVQLDKALFRAQKRFFAAIGLFVLLLCAVIYFLAI